MSQALEVYSKIQDPFTSAIQIGLHFAKSGMFGVDRAEAGTILALACITENQTPFEILRTYDIVLGKLRKKALACYAEFRAKGGRVKWLNTGDDGKEAVGEFTFEGQTLTVKFTIDDANKQGLVKNESAWKKTPGNMLRARVLSNAIGMLCPEIVAGVVDGEDESPAAEVKPVLQATTAPAAEKKATVVEVATVAEPVKTETASPEPATVEPAKETPKEIFVAKVDDKTGKLTNETVFALQSAIPDEHQAAALKWMEGRGWIKPLEDLRNLSLGRAQLILNKPQDFLNKVKATATQPATT